MAFKCPRCGSTSHHPQDEAHGYCGACHAFTGVDDDTHRDEWEAIIEADFSLLPPEAVAATAKHLARTLLALPTPKRQWTGLTDIEVVSGTAMEKDRGEAPDYEGTTDFRGFVTIRAVAEDGSFMTGQLAPDEVRQMAMNFLSTAEAADQDAIVFRLMVVKVGMPARVAAAFVMDMRKERGQ